MKKQNINFNQINELAVKVMMAMNTEETNAEKTNALLQQLQEAITPKKTKTSLL